MSTDLRGQLQRIYDRRGRLTPELVVEEARPADSPLHSHFEWDDSVAGEAWRRHQAHEMIRTQRVVRQDAEKPQSERTARAFHAIPAKGGAPNSYVYEPVEVVAADPKLTAIVLRDMEREWKQLYRRYSQFQEFIDMVSRDLEADRAA